MAGQGRDGVMIEYKDLDGNVIAIDPMAQYQHGIDYARSRIFSADVIVAAPQGYSVKINGRPTTLPAVVKKGQEITLVPKQPSQDLSSHSNTAHTHDDK